MSSTSARRLVAFLLAALACAPAAARAAGEERAQCLKAHEGSQLQRLDGHLLEARAELLLCARSSCPGPIRSDCAKWLAEVEQTLPSIIVAVTSARGDEPAASLFIDGQPIVQSGRALLIDPGEHQLRVELPPYAPIEQVLVIREGEHERRVELRFAPPPAPAAAPAAPATTAPASEPLSRPPPSARPVPWLTFVLVGASVAGVASATYFGASALAERASQREGCAPLCSAEEKSRVTRPALVADVSLVVALLAGAGAGYTYWKRPSVPLERKPAAGGAKPAPAGRFAALLGAKSGSLGYAGAF